jgi:hypothetical protein
LGTWAGGASLTISAAVGTYTAVGFAGPAGVDPCTAGNSHGFTTRVNVVAGGISVTLNLNNTLSAADCAP